MKRRAPHAAAGLDTGTVSCALIGGEGKFCAERFGWSETAEGLVSSYAAQPVRPAASVGSAVHAQYLPALGFSVIVSKYGQYFKWNTTDFAALKNLGVVYTYLPFIFPCVIDGADAYAAVSGPKVGIITSAGMKSSSIPNKLYRGTFHCGRVFAVDDADRFTVRWSGYSVTDWTQGIDGGGYIKLNPERGGVLDIVEYGDKLVLVRQNGLTVLNALGDARHYRVTQSEEYALPPVKVGTSVICGGQLWFYTSEGLYSYRGETPKRAELDLCGDTLEITRATAYRGRYLYLEGTLGTEKRIVEYDIQTGACAQFAKGCNMVFAAENGLYCLNGSAITELVKGGSDASRIWRSSAIDLGMPTAKTLKRITLTGEGDVTVCAYCDGRTAGTFGKGATRLCERGVSFAFEVKGNGKVTGLSAEWEVSK